MQTDTANQECYYYIVRKKQGVLTESLTPGNAKNPPLDSHWNLSQYSLGTYLIECANVFRSAFENPDEEFDEDGEKLLSISIKNAEDSLIEQELHAKLNMSEDDYLILKRYVLDSFYRICTNDKLFIGTYADLSIQNLMSCIDYIDLACDYHEIYCTKTGLYKFIYQASLQIPNCITTYFNDRFSDIHKSAGRIDRSEIMIEPFGRLGVPSISADFTDMTNSSTDLFIYRIFEPHELILASAFSIISNMLYISMCGHCHEYFISTKRNVKYCDGNSPKPPHRPCRVQERIDQQRSLDLPDLAKRHKSYRTMLSRRLENHCSRSYPDDYYYANKDKIDKEYKSMADTLGLFLDCTKEIRADIKKGARNEEYYLRWMELFYNNKEYVDSLCHLFLTVDRLYQILQDMPPRIAKY